MNKIILSAIFAVTIFISFSENASAVYSTDIIRDVPFAEINGQTLYMNVIYPVGKVTPSPAIIWLHGGGWISETKESAEINGAFELAELGYVVVPIDYRFSDVALFPAQIHDLRGAARFLRANAVTYDIIPGRIGTLGVSSGGTLALFAGMTNDEPAYWGDVGGNLEQSNEIKTVLNFFGSVSTIHLDELSVSKVNKIESLLGCEDAFMPECADELAEFAVENHSNIGDAIVETYHGTADNEVPYSQSKYVTTALKNDGVQAKLTLTPGYGHEMSMFFDYISKVKSFLKKNL